MKYIVSVVGKGEGNTQELPYVFPNNMVHELVAKAFEEAIKAHEWEFKGHVSAGEYNPVSGHCSGNSSSLGLESRPIEDTRLLMYNDYGVGYK